MKSEEAHRPLRLPLRGILWGRVDRSRVRKRRKGEEQGEEKKDRSGFWGFWFPQFLPSTYSSMPQGGNLYSFFY